MSDREELTRTVLRVEAERAAKEAAWLRPRPHPMQNMQPSTARLFASASLAPAVPIPEPERDSLSVLNDLGTLYARWFGALMVAAGVTSMSFGLTMAPAFLGYCVAGAHVVAAAESIGAAIVRTFVWVAQND